MFAFNLNPVDYINRAIIAFKLGWSGDHTSYDKYMAPFSGDQRNTICKLISDNERKWIARFRADLKDYEPRFPVIEGDTITDYNGVEVVEGDTLISLDGLVQAKLVLLPTEKESQFYAECIYSEKEWDSNDGILDDDCLHNWRKV